MLCLPFAERLTVKSTGDSYGKGVPVFQNITVHERNRGDNFLGSDKGIRLHPFVRKDLRPAPGGMADKVGAGLR